MNISEEKKKLRRELLRRRSSIEQQTKKQYDDDIFRNLLNDNIFRSADLVMTYISFGGEADTKNILEYLWKNKIKAAVPRCDTKNKTMQFCVIKSFYDTHKGSYGICEPDPECEIITDKYLKSEKKLVCIVPAVSFDEKNFRLGYGGGYYDRFLGKYKNIKSVGLCFDCLLQKELPVDEHDISVDVLITNK